MIGCQIALAQQTVTSATLGGRVEDSYRLSVEAQGFSPITKQFTVTVGQALDLPLRLEVAGVAAQVDISSDVPMIETVRTQVTETIQPGEIDHLPLNGRNYLDRALLVPGVSPTNTDSNQRFAERQLSRDKESLSPGSATSTTVSL